MKLGIEGMFLNIIKTIYDSIILNGEKLKTFPLKSEASLQTAILLLGVYLKEYRSGYNKSN
jgi:hypothetical protein